jgi:hypothetical protein
MTSERDARQGASRVQASDVGGRTARSVGPVADADGGQRLVVGSKDDRLCDAFDEQEGGI